MEGDYDCDANYGHVDAQAEVGEESLGWLLAGIVREGGRVREEKDFRGEE